MSQTKTFAEIFSELPEVTRKILDDFDFNVENEDSWNFVNGNLIDRYNLSKSEGFYTDGEIAVFINQRRKEKLLYWIGAENEAKLVFFYKNVAVYEEIDPDRLERYVYKAEVNS